MNGRFYLYLFTVILFCISGFTALTGKVQENVCENCIVVPSIRTNDLQTNDLHALIPSNVNTVTSEELHFSSKTFRTHWKNTIPTYTTPSFPNLFLAAYSKLMYSEHQSQLYAQGFYLYYLGKQII